MRAFWVGSLVVSCCIVACGSSDSDAGPGADTGGSSGTKGAAGSAGAVGNVAGASGAVADGGTQGIAGAPASGGASGNDSKAGGGGTMIADSAAGSGGEVSNDAEAGQGGEAGSNSEAGSGGAAGDSSEAGSGGAGASPAQLVLPILRGDRYTLEFEDTIFQVVAAGGQVVTFSIKGKNILWLSADAPSACPSCFGSTLWTSPQSAWNWPPPPAIDSNLYTVTVTDDTITMVSTVSTSGGPKVSITKKFTPDLSARAIELEYTVKNVGSVSVSLAPWEVTRLAAGGLSFFPILGSPYSSTTLAPSSINAGIAWIDLAVNPSGNNKLFADGNQSYWAHTDGSYLFVKSWSDVPANAQASGEGELEFYDGDTYVELENQGTYGPLAPGATRTYDVRWSLRELQPGQDRVVGDPELLSAARALAED